ncbi:MAG: glycosyltransferase family 87 protein [Actinomycetota bacterium]
MLVVLIVCTFFMALGFANKARCLNGQFNARAYGDQCYNDLQPLFGIRLFADVNQDGVTERVFPYIHGERDETVNELRDGAIEYPVLTGVFMWASSLPVDNGDDYLRISAILLAPFGLLIAYHLARMARWRALMWSAAPALILYAFHNWDFLVVAAAVGVIYAWWRGSPMWAALLFGVGAAFKMYPIFFLGPLFLELLLSRQPKRAFQAATVGVGTLAAINLPFALINFDGWIATYTFHQDRGANFDSMWCAMKDMCLSSGWTPDQLNTITAALTGGFFIAILAASVLIARKRGTYPFVQTCGALLATFLLFNKVHSPQYTLWLLPFVVLIGNRVVAWVGWALYAVADVAVYWGIFQWFSDYASSDFPTSEKVMLVGIWARAALLLGFVIFFVLSRPGHEPPEDPAGRTAPLQPPPLEGAAAAQV